MGPGGDRLLCAPRSTRACRCSGLCFGGQALSLALGGGVDRLARPEIGWFPIEAVDGDAVPARAVADVAHRADARSAGWGRARAIARRPGRVCLRSASRRPVPSRGRRRAGRRPGRERTSIWRRSGSRRTTSWRSPRQHAPAAREQAFATVRSVARRRGQRWRPVQRGLSPGAGRRAPPNSPAALFLSVGVTSARTARARAVSTASSAVGSRRCLLDWNEEDVLADLVRRLLNDPCGGFDLAIGMTVREVFQHRADHAMRDLGYGRGIRSGLA